MAIASQSLHLSSRPQPKPFPLRSTTVKGTFKKMKMIFDRRLTNIASPVVQGKNCSQLQ